MCSLKISTQIFSCCVYFFLFCEKKENLQQNFKTENSVYTDLAINIDDDVVFVDTNYIYMCR